MNFAVGKNLSRHVESVHEEKRPFKCDICNDVSFTGKAALNDHILSFHEKKLQETKVYEENMIKQPDKAAIKGVTF